MPVMIDAMKGNPSTAIWLEATQRKNCLLALVGSGFGQIVGAVFIGYVQDNFPNRITSFVCFVLSSFAISFTLIFVRVNSFSLVFGFALCFFWGLQDGGMNCFLNCILGF